MPFDAYCVKPVGRYDLLEFVETLQKRTNLNERSRESFSLASKKAALEVAGNEGTEEYEELDEHMREVREDVDVAAMGR